MLFKGIEGIKAIKAWQRLHRRTAWRPVVSDSDGPAGASKFSGTPWLARGESWPKCGCCRHDMNLVLQLDLAQVPKELRGDFGPGLLQFFSCLPMGRGCDGFFGQESRTRVLRVVKGKSGGKGKIQIPSNQSAPKSLVGWKPIVDDPKQDDRRMLGFRATSSKAKRYVDISMPDAYVLRFPEKELDRLWSNDRNDKLFGWPAWEQGNVWPYCPRCWRRMDLVFQIASYDNVPYYWGDVGRGHIMQCPIHKDQLNFEWACG